MDLPEIDHEFVCIVDRSKPELAAVISSYLSKPGVYLPMFEYPVATAIKSQEEDDLLDEHQITRIRSSDFNIMVNNAIAHLQGCSYIVLAGLSAEQKSYLDFLDHFSVIEIDSVDNVDFFLGSFTPATDFSFCTREQIWHALFKAVHNGTKLRIQDFDESPDLSIEDPSGIIVIEKSDAVSSIIAVNYAISVHAQICLVDELEEDEEKEVIYLIEEWKNGHTSSHDLLVEKIQVRIGEIDFSPYHYATFFTEGLPYSLLIKNTIPVTYVHLLYRCDFFVFNNLFYERKNGIHSAIVFSPAFFSDEETEQTIETMKANHYYVRELVDDEATVYNIDMHVKEFPFDLLHICSHGGEVDGYHTIEKFVDRDGVEHTVEYDEVASIAPYPGADLIPVTRKLIWRTFDGLRWRSPELKAKNYARHVFAEMIKATRWNTQKKEIRVFKKDVPGSCAVKCKFSNYQTMFQNVAGMHTAPIVFNNSCWSWAGISEYFLAGGVRGYIGTLWAIDNLVASQSAKTFYNVLFKGTVLNAFHQMHEICRTTDCENIYIFWGLHFASLEQGQSLQRSWEQVCKSLLTSFYRWHDKLNEVKNPEVKYNIQKLEDWNLDLLKNYFYKETMELRERQAQKRRQS
jgi:hypothetical protein